MLRAFPGRRQGVFRPILKPRNLYTLNLWKSPVSVLEGVEQAGHLFIETGVFLTMLFNLLD